MLLRDLCNKIGSIVKYGFVSLPGKDSLPRPISQITYYNKTAPFQVISPYGLSVNLPLDTKVVLFSINGHEENRAGIGFSQADRFKNLSPGEVVVGNPKTQAYVKFDKDGNIEIISKKDLNITTEGNLNITADDDVTIKCDTFNVEASTTNLGTGGNQIARLGDQVTVGGSTGTITGAGTNTSI